MKLKTHILSFVFLFCGIVSYAQLSISQAVSSTPVSAVPFNASKTTDRPHSICKWISNPGNRIPDRLYTNLQLTQYGHAHDEFDNGIVFRLFNSPYPQYKMLAISFGVYTDETIMLCSVDTNSGLVIDALEVSVMSDDIYAKQFRIDSNYQITVTRIVPESSTSILFSSLKDFVGHREDTVYSLSHTGTFNVLDTHSFYPKTYTRDYLCIDNQKTNLWEGNEVPISE